MALQRFKDLAEILHWFDSIGLEPAAVATLTPNTGPQCTEYRYVHPGTQMRVTVSADLTWSVSMPSNQCGSRDALVDLTWTLSGIGLQRLAHVVKLYEKDLPSLAVTDDSLRRVTSAVNKPLDDTAPNRTDSPRTTRYEVTYAYDNPVTKQKPVLFETNHLTIARVMAWYYSWRGDVYLFDHLTGGWRLYQFNRR